MKNNKANCVYAGPEMMRDAFRDPPKPDDTEQTGSFCPNCGHKTSGDHYCPECGTPLTDKNAIPPTSPMAVYAGPEFFSGVSQAPGAWLKPQEAEKKPYPQNFVSGDEEPIDVYAGPPVDCDE